jgi:sulfate adenylyltransferase
MGAFKEPHGDVLKQLYLPESAAEQEKLRARDYRSWDLTPRQLCDIELILNGAFSPLEGFLTEAEYQRVVRDMRLPSGTLWPIPVTLDVSVEFAGATSKGEHIGLRDAEGVLIATMEVSDIWEPDKGAEASGVYGTQDQQHPGVYYLMHRAGGMYLGGKLRGVEPATWYDFKLLRDSPAELRGRFRKLGWRKVVAFQTRNPMHRAHHEMSLRAAREAEANLLIHPVIGMTRPGDVDHYTGGAAAVGALVAELSEALR